MSVSFNKVADVMQAQGVSELELDGVGESALGLYTESLELHRAIVREFGRTPQALRDMMASHARMVLVAHEHGELARAGDELEHCRALLAELEAHGWTDARTPADRAWVEEMAQQLKQAPEPT